MIIDVIRLLTILSAIFLLTGCGDETATPTVVPSGTGVLPTGIAETVIQKPDYRIKIPSSWRELPLNELNERVLTNSPQAVFQANDADSGIFANVIVTNENLPTSLTTLEFSEQTVQNESVTLIGYQKFSEAEAKISGQDTKLIEFEARAEASGRNLRFLQTFLLSKGKGYVFTAGVAPQANATTKDTVLWILKNIESM